VGRGGRVGRVDGWARGGLILSFNIFMECLLVFLLLLLLLPSPTPRPPSSSSTAVLCDSGGERGKEETKGKRSGRASGGQVSLEKL
jgi:hypothetical protein